MTCYPLAQQLQHQISDLILILSGFLLRKHSLSLAVNLNWPMLYMLHGSTAATHPDRLEKDELRVSVGQVKGHAL